MPVFPSKKKEDSASVTHDEEVLRRREELKGATQKDFEVLDTLGTGSFGRVRLVRHKKSGKVYALKMLSKNLVLRTKQVDHIIAEKEIIADIKHPFIVQMFHAFQDPKKLYLVLEFVVGGEFFTHLRQANRFPNDTAKFYAAQVVSTFDYLHTRNIIYRDLKPENLLLDRSGYLKVTDFGFAKRIDPASKTWTLCGTPEYLAPEIILNKGHGKAVDWWALGILIYEMLVGYPPFYSDDRMQLYQNILAGKIEYPSFVNRTARDLINRLLTADLTRRIGNLRGGAKDVKRHAWFRGIDWDKLNERALPAPIQPSLSGEDDLSLFDKYPDEDETEFLPIDEAEQVHFRDF